MTARASALSILVVLAAAGAAACSDLREVDRVAGSSCRNCHGTSGNPSEPFGLVDTADPRVGAHATHLGAGGLRAPIACAECHVQPREGDTAHADGHTDVVWGALASAGGASPAWNAGAASCSSVYCHGATLQGGANTTPIWTRVDGTQAACGACHGLPPPPPHPASDACAGCHAGYTASTVDPETHVDGVVQVGVGGAACTACHGDSARQPAELAAAPPRGADGETDPSTRAVGAHEAHLRGARLGRAIACEECHVVPATLAHVDGAVAIAFGPLATTGGTAPAWRPATLSCGATYCHGGSLAGGARTEPVWTQVDGSQVACGSCHGAPPPEPHPQSSACGSCHAGYGAGTVNAALHLDGHVDVSGGLTCSSCHGDPARAAIAGADPRVPAAPPVDTRGESSATARGVGAHLAHVNDAASLARPIACAECHPVPTSSAHSDGAVQVALGARSASDGASPAWNVAAGTCTTYCHGATLGGGTLRTPSWTGGAAAGACGACHGRPPPDPHPQSTSCGGCHPGYTAATVNVATHVNGVVDATALSCASCHGDPARAFGPKEAPPRDTAGGTATTARGVGAHQSHLRSALLTGGVTCNECHVVPTSNAHANGAVTVTFGTRARTGGVAAAWNTTALTCTAYCHGATLTGGSARTPLWTRVDGTQKTCGSCHGAPPTSGRHRIEKHVGRSCGDCHGSGYTSSAVASALHVNGVRDVGNRITSWNASTRTCAHSCHGDKGTW